MMNDQADTSRLSGGNKMGIGIAIGVGVGTALGASSGDAGMGVAYGAAAGILLGGLLNILSARSWVQFRATWNDDMSPSRKYVIRFALGMAAYVILVPLSVVLLDRVEDSLARTVVALLPVLPVPYVMVAFMQSLRGLDELQRRIQLEAVGFSLGITGLVTFTLGFLENAGGPRLSMVWVLPMMVIFWALGQMIAGRRYE